VVLPRRALGSEYPGRGAPATNAAAARTGPRGFAAKLDIWGRVGGYEVDFTRRITAATLQNGPLEVKSSASVYRTVIGARAALTYGRRQLIPAGYAPLAVSFRVGQDAHQWVSQGESGVGTLLRYVLIWRERNVDASIVVTGRVGVVSAAEVAPLVLRQDARIRAALR